MDDHARADGGRRAGDGDGHRADDGSDDPHRDGRVHRAGADLDAAAAAVIMCHGRGATARSMLQFAAEFSPGRAAYLAPGAADNTWYPRAFTAPVETNEPHLSSALSWVDDLVSEAVAAGVDRDHVVVLGFSQGACLATEYAARNARRYGGVVGLSGGLIGDTVDDGRYAGDFAGTPVFLGCSDRDPHIPVERVHETARVLEALGADVDERIYPGMGHTVNGDELAAVDTLLSRVVGE